MPKEGADYIWRATIQKKAISCGEGQAEAERRGGRHDLEVRHLSLYPCQADACHLSPATPLPQDTNSTPCPAFCIYVPYALRL